MLLEAHSWHRSSGLKVGHTFSNELISREASVHRLRLFPSQSPEAPPDTVELNLSPRKGLPGVTERESGGEGGGATKGLVAIRKKEKRM